MVECMSAVVNVMLSLMSVMSPPPALLPIVAHYCEVMYFGSFVFRGELGFLNCDDSCMCVANKQFELLEFVFESVYGVCQEPLQNRNAVPIGLTQNAKTQ